MDRTDPMMPDLVLDQAGLETLSRSLIRKAALRQLPLSELIGAEAKLRGAGQITLAIELYKIWIASNPEDGWLYVAYFNYGTALKDSGDLYGAINAFRACLRIKPDFYGSYINLGRSLEDAGQVDAAVAQWTAMVDSLGVVNGEILSYVIIALQQIGRTLRTAKEDGRAEEAHRRGLELNPRQPEVIHQWVALRQSQCKWPLLEGSQYLAKSALVVELHPLSAINLTDDPLFHLGCAHRYNKTILKPPSIAPLTNRRVAHTRADPARLRIGYVSSDLREHAVGFAMTDVIETHDRARFEIYAYYCGIDRIDATRTRIAAAADHWLDINAMSDADVARRIQSDGIDILIDLNGFTLGARTEVFALRPAPVLVNWFGFPCTMGTPYHHYLIADPTIIPDDSKVFYSEKVLYLDCYQPNDRKRIAAESRPSRAMAGLPEEGFVFCCLNGLQKLTAITFDRWMTILCNVPGSVLWLLAATDETNERLHQRAESHGIARERLIFAQRAANADHLARYPLADLFLDNLPYGAHTTAADAMWMGVPILTLPGRSFGSRVCASLVRAAGVSEMICASAEDYVARAIDYGLNPEKLAPIKAKLVANRDTCLLFDTPRLVADLERLYEAMAADLENNRLPVPDMTNIETYHEIGTGLNHEATELLSEEAYRDLYRSGLKARHELYPLKPDGRLWQPAPEHAAPVPGALRQRSATPAQDPARLLSLAEALRAEGRFEDALALFDHLNQGHPDHLDIRRGLIATLGEKGDVVEALTWLAASKDLYPDTSVFIADIQTEAPRAIEAYNVLRQTGEIRQARDHAVALVALVPGDPTFLSAALACSRLLGDQGSVARYARTLVSIDATNEEGHAALIEVSKASGAIEDEIRHRLVLALSPTLAIHPLLRLRDLVDIAGLILCRPLTPASEEQLSRIQAAARTIEVDAAQNAEWAVWDKHYRMVLQATDLSALDGEAALAPDPAVMVATSLGVAVPSTMVQTIAARRGARVVFFAAADEAYLDLYGRWYILSILKFCDVSCLVVVHVIGGRSRLGAIAERIGIRDERVLFSGDDIDETAAACKSYDAPPKGLFPKPVAYLQSVRFLRLGGLLDSLRLPVFVSDIDLLLQRGVADLLQRFAEADVVLNENMLNSQAASRITANLLLVNPTDNAAAFVRFLKGTLQAALQKDEVTRWIDQAALLLARHYIMRTRPSVRLGYFDTASDINNQIYPSYQQHPFRFLSMYHGFDVKSLEDDPRVLGDYQTVA